MTMNRRLRLFPFALGCVWLLIVTVGTVRAQELEEGEVPTGEDNYPEEVASFYRTFLDLYMENYRRISDLKSIRAAGSEEEAQSVKERLQDHTSDVLRELRNQFQAAREKGTGEMVLNSMDILLNTYPLYVRKVVNNWEPTEEEILQRRRMSENEIAEDHPEIAGPALLRRKFLGELISGVMSVPQMSGWFVDRLSRVRSWIRTKYNELFPLFVRLVSRVDRVQNNDEVAEEKRRQVIRDVRSEWNRFWQDTGESTSWKKIRRNLTELRSLFQDRSNRLPGTQDEMKQDVQRLQKKIGNLQQLDASKPFTSRSNRLEAMLHLSRAFVKRANELGNTGVSQAITTPPMMFAGGHLDQTPGQIWGNQDLETLQQKKEDRVEELSDRLYGLRRANYKQERKRFKFPIEAINNIVGRLGTNYGKQVQAVAKDVREMSEYVQALYWLSTEGVELMQTYQQALEQVEVSQPDQMVKFERAFREQYKTEIRNLNRESRVITRMRDRLEEVVRAVDQVRPQELISEREEEKSQKN